MSGRTLATSLWRTQRKDTEEDRIHTKGYEVRKFFILSDFFVYRILYIDAILMCDT